MPDLSLDALDGLEVPSADVALADPLEGGGDGLALGDHVLVAVGPDAGLAWRRKIFFKKRTVLRKLFVSSLTVLAGSHGVSLSVGVGLEDGGGDQVAVPHDGHSEEGLGGGGPTVVVGNIHFLVGGK